LETDWKEMAGMGERHFTRRWRESFVRKAAKAAGKNQTLMRLDTGQQGIDAVKRSQIAQARWQAFDGKVFARARALATKFQQNGQC
jgi:hypothetical protein